jgi:enolase-phosphatase E1
VSAIRAVVTDIEGTTSSIAFVKDVLFPYARAHLREYVRAHAGDPAVAGILRDVAAAHAGEPAATLERWIDEDRKETGLKTLQGMIWLDAYVSGAVRGHVYEDAVAALRKWHAAGIALYVYSSGSVAAQKLLFAHSAAGDLTPLFSGYFDTTTGPKGESGSYERIAERIGGERAEILFLSDSPAEIEAAARAGLRTAQLCRPEDTASCAAESFRDFTAIDAGIVRA